MARGGFTEKEIEALKNHKYVVYVDNNKVVYSNEFKWIIWRFSTARGCGQIFRPNCHLD